ncbi:fibronectin type III domain-containing protein [Candidatus Poribacteria bacterium]|nr:fibronectin type III domain-containing protein [Candidatus Poribacteria bacterium]
MEANTHRMHTGWRQGVVSGWIALGLTILIGFVGTGCFVDVTDEGDDEAPAAPRGVYSVSGDNEVIIRWYANGEKDLDGYEVWRSRDAREDYRRIATVDSHVTEYVDRDVRNGTTYFYAVLAFDRSGHSSAFSPETVEDTPRPEGFSVTLSNFRLNPSRSGFSFSRANSGATHWDRNGDDLLDRDLDVFFGFDTEVNIAYLYSDHDDLFMQDLGYREDMTDVDVAPVRGYTTIATEMLEGHAYAFYTPDGHYAKIRVRRVSEEALTFDWAYQLQRDNTDLAPGIAPASVTRGRPAKR